jgi:hypothetical protein
MISIARHKSKKIVNTTDWDVSNLSTLIRLHKVSLYTSILGT